MIKLSLYIYQILNMKKMLTKANKDHLADILLIEKKSFQNPWSYASFSNELNSKVASNWVYLKELKVSGYIFGWNIDSDYYINNIAVSPDYRRRGIAMKLLNNIIKKLNLENIYLEVSRINQKAISLYEKMGFKENGIRKNYYSNNTDAILYKMELK